MEHTIFFLSATVLATALISPCCAFATGEVTWTSWRKQTIYAEITGQVQKVKSRSRFECVALCGRNVQCSAFVYNSTSRTCAMLPQLSLVNDYSQQQDFFSRADVLCTKEQTSYTPLNGSVTKWTFGWTTLQGNIICDDDFISTTNDVTILCDLLNGTWTMLGRCAQRVWKYPNSSTFLPVPKPPVSGWSVCVDGVPTALSSFSVNLVASDLNSRPLHTDFRFRLSGQYLYNIVMDILINGSWKGANVRWYNATTYPFSVGVPFKLRWTVTGTGFYQIFENGAFLTQLGINSQLAPAKTTAVLILSSVNVSMVNTWCP